MDYENEEYYQDEGYYDELDRDHDEDYEPEYDDSMDGDHASGLASAGWGTDEDYAGWDTDSWYEEQYDIGDDY